MWLTMEKENKPQITKEKCAGCPVFENNENQDNMIKYNICGKRENVGCEREE